jgi:acetate kinase
MGLTRWKGWSAGTRSGDVDGIFGYLAEQAGQSAAG